jgi:hypothetical protein
MTPKPEPNFIRLHPGLPEITILITAMLQAREVVAAQGASDEFFDLTRY